MSTQLDPLNLWALSPRDLVAWLRTEINRPVGERRPLLTHENGYVIWPLPNGARLHVWPDRLGDLAHQRQSVPYIHDHRFTFRSRILCGLLTHTTYDVVPGYSHVVHDVLQDGPQAGTLQPGGQTCDVVVSGRYPFTAGSEYRFCAGQFHMILPTRFSASLVIREHTDATRLAHVLVPTGEAVDNAHDRLTANPEFVLTTLVDRALDLVASTTRAARL